jgi:ankyrin repeat protein
MISTLSFFSKRPNAVRLDWFVRAAATRLGSIVVLAACSSTSLFAGPSWHDVKSVVTNRDLARIESLIRENGGVTGFVANGFVLVSTEMAEQATLEKLLAMGVPVDGECKSGDYPGRTALIQAAINGNKDLIRFLLKKGANPNYVGNCGYSTCKGHTPLLCPVDQGSLDVVELLLKAGADPNGIKGVAVANANSKGDVGMYQLLLKHGGRLPPEESAKGGTGHPAGSAYDDQFRKLRKLGLSELLPTNSTLVAASTNRERCRLAVISDDGNSYGASVLVARLSAESGIELIERQELDRILAEQQLTKKFVASGAGYERVGDLLRADALVLVQSRKLNNLQVVEARFIKVNPGIVLDAVYTTAPVGNHASWAQNLSWRVRDLATKTLNTNAIVLSVLDVQASISTPLSRELERAMNTLFRDRLIHDPRFVVLERAQMDRLSFENGDRNPFRSGSYVVDPALHPALDNSGNFKLVVKFRPLHRGEGISITASGHRTAPAGAVEDVLQQVGAKLGQEAPDLVAEAQKYLEESRWAMEAGLTLKARTDAEAAWALGIRTADVLRLRTTTAQRVLIETHATLEAAERLDLGLHVAGLWRDALDRVGDDQADLRTWVEMTPDIVESCKLAIISTRTAVDQIRQADRIAALQQSCWALLQDAWDRARQFPSDSDLANRISESQIGSARLLLPHANDVVPVLQEILSRHFGTNDLLTRANIRMGVASALDNAATMVNGASHGYSVSRRLSNLGAARSRLIDGLRSSPDPEDRFLANLLNMTSVPALMESFWEMGPLLAQNGKAFRVYFQPFFNAKGEEPMVDGKVAPRVFQVNLTDRGRTQKVATDTFDFRRRMYIHLLNHARKHQPEFDQMLVWNRYSPEGAAEVREAVARLAARGGVDPAPPAKVAVKTAPKPPARLPAPGTPTLQVTEVWHPFNLGLPISQRFQITGWMRWFEDKIWFHGHEVDQAATVARHFLFAFDPAAKRTEVFPLPEGPPATLAASAGFIVTPTHFIVNAHQDFLGIFDRATKRWDLYREIKPVESLVPEIMGDMLFLMVKEGTSTALVQFDLRRRNARVLASNQRKPAEGPLDDPTLGVGKFWPMESDELAVTAESRDRSTLTVQAWSPKQQTWRLLQSPRKRSEYTPPPGAKPGLATGFIRAGLVTLGPLQGGAGMVAIGRPGDAPGRGLLLNLFEQGAPARTLPIELRLNAPLRMPPGVNRQPNLALTYDNCLSSPAGLVFNPRGSSAFWFLPKRDWDAYLARVSRSLEMAGEPAAPK